MPRTRPDPQEIRDLQLLQNSVERVINTTKEILEEILSRPELVKMFPQYMREDYLDVNLEDWEELKEVTVHTWNEARNEAFKRDQAREQG